MGALNREGAPSQELAKQRDKNMLQHLGYVAMLPLRAISHAFGFNRNQPGR